MAAASSGRSPLATLGPQSLPALSTIEPGSASKVQGEALKRIESDEDVQLWKTSKAHELLVLYVARLCEAAVGQPTELIRTSSPQTSSAKELSPAVAKILEQLDELSKWIDDIAPRAGPQRFGNLAFRDWGARLETESIKLHQRLLPQSLHAYIPELQSYLLGAFGSWIRLDYGSGHELSFVAWLCFLERLGYFSTEIPLSSGKEEGEGLRPPQQSEKDVALVVFPRYLVLAWKLQDAYGLEPAGSHGVWGLDDYQFLPYAIGAAQLRQQYAYVPSYTARASHRPPTTSPPVTPEQLLAFVPTSASASLSSSDPRVGRGGSSQQESFPPFANLYTSSIARIHAKKRGPFFEHSPILNDIATTVPNWVKVHQGMLKMWDAECLGKRPVVQHFVFGKVGFVWEGSGSSTARVVGQGKEETNVAAAAAPLPRSGMPAPTGAPWATSTSTPSTMLPPRLARPRPSAETKTGFGSGRGLAPTMSTQVPGNTTLASTGSAAASSSPFGRLSRPTTTGPLSRQSPNPSSQSLNKQ